MQPEIKISLTEFAHNIFQQLKIDPLDYRPAYDGESVGLDLYNMGLEKQVLGRNKWTVFGEEPQTIPTGIRICLPRGTVGLIKERGSISETGLILRAGVIDPGYTGEIFVNVLNVGERDTVIPVGAKLPFQLIVVPHYCDFKTVPYQEYLTAAISSSRREGNLGSSDLK
tara:strand:- start:1052 stop:1558 length:507 start_codon:yes stop_codon:yes gene_type:complete